jgi:hypothetical protein
MSVSKAFFFGLGIGVVVTMIALQNMGGVLG